MNKNEKIKQTLLETKQRRLTQRPFVFTLKIDYSKLNKKSKDQLNQLFLESKWFYNFILSQEEPFKVDTKIITITKKDKDKNDIKVDLKLPAKYKQSIMQTMIDNMRGLKNRKLKGGKIGKLKFKSSYNSINLNQFGITHKFLNKDKIKIMGIKQHLRVFGINQINKDYEFANAKLIKKPTGYYIYLTCYENINLERVNVEKSNKSIGIDFGIKTNITTSENERFDICVKESVRLKGLQKKLARQHKGTKARFQTLNKIRICYENQTNKKKDKANKLVNYLCSNYQIVYMQDEMIKGWHKELFGKQIQHSCLGNLKSKLMSQSNVKVIDKSYPTTKLCYNCGTLHKEITLNDREFICPFCNLSEERDLKAAKTILLIGQCKNTYLPTEHRNTGLEKLSDFVSSFEQIKLPSMKVGSSRL